MTKQQKKKRLIYIGVVSFWIALFVLIGVISSLISPITAQAIVLSENNVDNTEIEDDLSDLDWSEYPPDNKGTIKIIEFVEYCYTDNVFKQSHYGLYLYIYNPMQLSFSPNEGANVINMATSYDDNGKPIEGVYVDRDGRIRSYDAGCEQIDRAEIGRTGRYLP